MGEVRNPMTTDPTNARELAKQHAYIRDVVQTRAPRVKNPGIGSRTRFEKGVTFTKETEEALEQELLEKDQDN